MARGACGGALTFALGEAPLQLRDDLLLLLDQHVLLAQQLLVLHVPTQLALQLGHHLVVLRAQSLHLALHATHQRVARLRTHTPNRACVLRGEAQRSARRRQCSLDAHYRLHHAPRTRLLCGGVDASLAQLQLLLLGPQPVNLLLELRLARRRRLLHQLRARTRSARVGV